MYGLSPFKGTIPPFIKSGVQSLNIEYAIIKKSTFFSISLKLKPLKNKKNYILYNKVESISDCQILKI